MNDDLMALVAADQEARALLQMVRARRFLSPASGGQVRGWRVGGS
jgi:hypothetical protein